MKWQKIFTWFTGYLSRGICVCGCFYQKSPDKEIRSTVKCMLVATVIFTLIDALRLVVANIMLLIDKTVSGINKVWITFAIIEVVVFVALCALGMAGKLTVSVDE